jgi:hypothetical protein
MERLSPSHPLLFHETEWGLAVSDSLGVMPSEATPNHTPSSPGASRCSSTGALLRAPTVKPHRPCISPHLVPLSLAILGTSQSVRLCDEQVVDGSWHTLCQAAQVAGRPGYHYNADENSL